jgi:hypothetical protein
MAEQNGQVLETNQQTDNDQVLDGGRQTDPQTGEDEIDVTQNLGKRFVLNPKRPDLTMTGEELRNAAGRAKLVDQTQSELHKAQERIRELEAKNAEVEKHNELLKLIKESRSSLPEEDEDVYNYEEPQSIDKKVIRQQIEPELNEFKAEATELRKKVQEVEQREKQREERLRFQQFGQQMRSAEEIALRKEFPSLTQAEVNEMLANADAIDNLTTQSSLAAIQGDSDTAMELKVEARERQSHLTQLRVSAVQKQRQMDERQRAKVQLETKSTTDIEMPDVLKKVAKNPKEAREREKALIEFTRQQSRNRQLLRKTVG